MHNYFGWSTVAKLPDGVFATVCSGYRLRHVDPFGKCVISYSRDNGKSWSNPAILIDTPYDDRDGGIAVGKDGRVIVTSFVCRPQSQKNCLEYYENNVENSKKVNNYIKAYLDMVETPEMFNKYFGATFVVSEDGGYTFGDVQMAPVTNPHGPAPLPDGSFLFVGNKMHSFDKINSGEKEPICCYKYTADGEFEFLSEIDGITYGEACEPYAYVCEDGKIIVHIRVNSEQPDKFTLYQCESYDGGKNFNNPRQILSDLGGAPSHIMRHSSGVLIASYSYREEPQGIRLMFSNDNGETWDTDYTLFDKCYNKDCGYPSTVELPDGKLLTVFYAHNQENPVNTSCVIKQIIWEMDK